MGMGKEQVGKAQGIQLGKPAALGLQQNEAVHRSVYTINTTICPSLDTRCPLSGTPRLPVRAKHFQSVDSGL